tara:strand:- start:9131 stop:10348 length:1218 start_codon:yes stop_codon:yes gene_type:complete
MKINKPKWLPKDSNEWSLFILCFILAILLEVQVVAGNPNAREVFVLEAVPVNLPSEYKVDSNDLFFDIELSGGRTRLNNLLLDTVDVEARFDTYPEGSGLAQATLLVRPPKGQGIKHVGGAKKVSIYVQKWLEQDIPVEVYKRGEAPNGVQIVDWQLEPKSVKVSGSVDLMNTLNMVEVELNLGTIVESENKNLKPLARDENGRLIRGLTFYPDEIRVEVVAQTVRDKRVVSISPDLIGELESGFFISSIAIDPATIIIEGPVKIIRNLTSVKTNPISLEGKNETFELMIDVFSPSETTSNPKKVNVAVEVSQIISDLEISSLIPIKVIGGGYTANPSSINLVIRGPVNQIAKWIGKESDLLDLIHVEVSACNNVDSCEREVIVALPSGLATKTISPNYITLNKN